MQVSTGSRIIIHAREPERKCWHAGRRQASHAQNYFEKISSAFGAVLTLNVAKGCSNGLNAVQQ